MATNWSLYLVTDPQQGEGDRKPYPGSSTRQLREG